MQVRHKKLGVLTVLDESALYYIIDLHEHSRPPELSCLGDIRVLPKVDCELVPEEQWEDVTGEFKPNDHDRDDYFISEHVNLCLMGKWSDYRLRKICVNESEDSVFHQITTAFIVERKK